jgi:hypothetical protein
MVGVSITTRAWYSIGFDAVLSCQSAPAPVF